MIFLGRTPPARSAESFISRAVRAGRESARRSFQRDARTFAGRCSRTTVAFVLAFSAGIFSSVLPANAANIQNIDLGKAAQVWFAEDHTVPIIAFNISLPAGSAYDPGGKAGLAAFAGGMMDEGAGGLDSRLSMKRWPTAPSPSAPAPSAIIW